jgi:hypothetical protein
MMFQNKLNVLQSTSNYQAIISIIAMVMLAVFVGLIASTANLVLIVMLVGVMVGILLLSIPHIIIWIILPVGMMSGLIVARLGSSSGKVIWGISLLSMLLILPVIKKLLGGVKGIPSFIWLFFIFMLFTIIATVLTWSSLTEFLTGYKRYFQMYGLMFALALLDFNADDHRRWLKLMFYIALLQLPFCLYQYFVLAPVFTSAALKNDAVQGTMGGGLDIASQAGDMPILLITAAAFVVARHQAKLVSTPATFFLSIALLFPLILGESKIVVILLPLTWFILMRKNFAKIPVRFFLQILGVLLLTSIFAFAYLSLSHKGNISKSLEGALSYNMGTEGYGDYRLNRTTVLSFWWENQSWNDPLSALIGNGLGSTYFNPTSFVQGHLGIKYNGWGIALTSASIMLWEIGLLGLLFFLCILSSAWFSAGRLWTKVTDPTIRADALAIQACIAMLMLFVFYNASMVSFVTLEIMTAFVLGYLGYLVRTHLPK